ncbi:DUF935 domain-containing protein [Glaciimonas immobilis]|uniref:Phage gp29-like protein n=1 Tax=Glaciimonas immobilis TaxID=728004 RepID=A0A840RLG2_9BURK|nr:DUF935 family protein [Glaciimonas immobilis]KAF3999055.1 DUF935 family protein [Glaciimonas immobilis]MBB5198485.1 phage gp29-like protein [Glaciimonas immobilis]
MKSSATPKGLYLPDGTFARFSDRTGLLADQIATRATASGVASIGMLLPNPDPVLRKLGKSIQVYRDLRSDAHIGGCIRRRKAAVKALKWDIERGQANARVTSALQAIFARLPMQRIIGEIHDAAFYGYQPLEVIWGNLDGLIVPVDVIGKPAEWFAYDDQNQPRFRSNNAPHPGELLLPRKFLIARQDPTYENPYGQPDLARCFWPTKFKQAGMDFWFKFIEKYGTPWVIGKTPRSNNDAENDRLLDMLANMIQDAVAVIPDDASVEIMEAGGKAASGDVHENFLQAMRAEVTIALLGQNQSTEASSTHASATSGLVVTAEIRDEDKSMISGVVNELIGWVCDLNFAGPHPEYKMWEEEAVDVTLATRDETLSRAGARFTNSYWQRTYDLQASDLSEDALPVNLAMSPVAEHPTFAEHTSKPSDPPSMMAHQLSRDLMPVMDDWIGQIKNLVEQAATLDEVRDGLLALAPTMSLDQYTSAMGLALNAAATAGRFEIMDEANG